MNPCKFVDKDEIENLRLDYQQTIEYIKLLTEIRFKLLVFTPVISGITIAFSEYLFKNNEIAFIIGVLGFIATFGIVIYDQRNTQIYETANGRAKYLEQKLNFPESNEDLEILPKQSDDVPSDCRSTFSKDNKYGGLFMDKPAPDRMLLWRILACHDRGLALVYSASISGWSFLIVYSVLHILLNYGPSYLALNEITNYIYSIVIAAAFGIIFFYNLELLDRGCRNKKLQKLRNSLSSLSMSLDRSYDAYLLGLKIRDKDEEIKKYFDNIHKIEGVISQLDAGRLPTEEAKKLFETAKGLIEECEAILNSYSGTIEEMSFVPTGT